MLGLDEDLYEIKDEEARKAIKQDLNDSNAGCLFVLIGLALVPFEFGISLLVIFFGATGIFGKKHFSGVAMKVRPTHSPAIRDLIDELKRGSSPLASANFSKISR